MFEDGQGAPMGGPFAGCLLAFYSGAGYFHLEYFHATCARWRCVDHDATSIGDTGIGPQAVDRSARLTRRHRTVSLSLEGTASLDAGTLRMKGTSI